VRTIPRIRRALRAHACAALDLLWPPRCPRCQARAEDAREQFCAPCWNALRPLRAGEAAWQLAPDGSDVLPASGAFAVDALFLAMLAASKYRGFRPVGRRLAAEAVRRLPAIRPEGTLVPVPLRPDKRRARGFNQTEDFARALAAVTGWAVRTDWLERRRGGPALAGLDRTRRAAAVRGAFRATPAFPGESAGPLILADDVVTTGSTAQACAAALRAGGAGPIAVVVMGRAFPSGADAPPPDLEILGRL